jgi:hypothetical protein
MKRDEKPSSYSVQRKLNAKEREMFKKMFAKRNYDETVTDELTNARMELLSVQNHCEYYSAMEVMLKERIDRLSAEVKMLPAYPIHMPPPPRRDALDPEWPRDSMPTPVRPAPPMPEFKDKDKDNLLGDRLGDRVKVHNG